MTTSALPRTGSRALPWVAGLAAHGQRPALVTADGTMTYAALSARVDALAERLTGARRLVLVRGAATPETVVAYLAALAAGHVVLLAPAEVGGPGDRLLTAYDPDVVLDAEGAVDVRREASVHDLHDELDLLLSTSGSTGSPKLVRLSADNLAANAGQIAGYLDIREDDCAAMTLPLTYCYGLSVLHTHLAVGASVLLTDLSVVDECFWELFRAVGATTFPAVPHTFELLGRSGFAGRDLPSLRYVTQAGGRMDADRVRHWAEVGRERGWDLYVMYGQCEATARMAWLPPHLALEHPGAVGLPVPGASLEIVDGEIVFRGPNVMLGYATGPADLALGRTVDELRTGDLGRLTETGLLEVVGRRARFVKVLGHRVDLDALEHRLRNLGHEVRCAGRDGLVVVSTTVTDAVSTSMPTRSSVDDVRRAALRACGAPWDAVCVVPVDAHPSLASGKPDYPAILALRDASRTDGTNGDLPDDVRDPHDEPSVGRLYASLLRRPNVADDASFVTLGGDSLSYVEVSIRLEQLLGHLPPGWHLMTVCDLEEARRTRQPDELCTADLGADGRSRRSATRDDHRRRPRWSDRWNGRWSGRPASRSVESSVWLRALAIVLIVGTHSGLFALQGTANALLVIAGYQLVRFQLGVPDRLARVVRVARGAVRVAAPALVVIVAAHLVTGRYEPRNLVLLNWVFGQERLGPPWRFWFVEALVLALVLTAVLFSVPAFHRLERRHPLGLPVALCAAAFVLFRLPLLPLPVPRMHGSALVVLHLFLLGWALARATTDRQRRLLSVLAAAMVLTFSFNLARDGLTLAFVLVLMWLPVTRVPARLVPVVRVLAAASLYIYVIHWQALELLWGRPVLAFAGSLALGIAYWWCWTRGPAAARALVARAAVWAGRSSGSTRSTGSTVPATGSRWRRPPVAHRLRRTGS